MMLKPLYYNSLFFGIAYHCNALRGQSHCRDLDKRITAANDTFAVVLRAFVLRAFSAILARSFWNVRVDELLISIYGIPTVIANYTFFMIHRLSRDSVTGPLQISQNTLASVILLTKMALQLDMSALMWYGFYCNRYRLLIHFCLKLLQIKLYLLSVWATDIHTINTCRFVIQSLFSFFRSRPQKP